MLKESRSHSTLSNSMVFFDTLGIEKLKDEPAIQYPQSDTEMEFPAKHSLSQGALSDTEMEYSNPSTRKEDWEWEWGALPMKKEFSDGEREDEEFDSENLKKDTAAGVITSIPSVVPKKDVETSSKPEVDESLKSSKESDSSSTKSMNLSDFLEKPKFQTNCHERLCVILNNPSCKVEISMLSSLKISNEKQLCSKFDESIISLSKFLQTPKSYENPALIARLSTAEDILYVEARAIYPLLLAKMTFPHEPITMDHLRNFFQSSSERNNSSFGWRSWWSRSSASTTTVQLEDKKVVLETSANDSVEIPKGRIESQKRSKTPQKTDSQFVKTLRLNSDQLKSLSLAYGANSVTFSVAASGALCSARIFLYKYDAKIVISDIDGTITKSDALGHLFTMVGKDWTHSGVASLFSAIVKNGYCILYLTSRAIGQANFTREYLKGIEQGQFQLPDGPVIMSPDRLLTAFRREVIIGRPEEFKIACLRDILRLFGTRNPFYAGFGNRITDGLSYRSVGIPPSRIFTINSQGELKLELLSIYKSSYGKLNDLVDQIFPPEKQKIEELYSDFSYWRVPLPVVTDIPKELMDRRHRSNEDLLYRVGDEEDDDSLLSDGDYDEDDSPYPFV